MAKTETQLTHDVVWVMQMADKLGERCGEQRQPGKGDKEWRITRDAFQIILNNKLPNLGPKNEAAIWDTFWKAAVQKNNELTLRQDLQEIVSRRIDTVKEGLR